MEDIEKEPLITVLIPCYNAMPFLPEALESIMNQTYTNLEIICLNDGSTDQTSKVLERFSTTDPRIKVVHNDYNLRLIGTLNKGIKLAKGNYIARMDSDDISHPNRLEVLLNHLVSSPEIDLISSSFAIFENNLSESKPLIHRCLSTKTILFSSFLFTPIAHATILCKTSILKENQYNQQDHCIHVEDYELWARLLRSGKKLVNIEDVLYFVRRNENSVSFKYSKKQASNFVTMAQIHYEQVFANKIPVNIAKVFVNRIDKQVNLHDWCTGIIRILYFPVLYKKTFFTTYYSRMDFNTIVLIRNTHLFDVLIQSIKYGKISIKVLSSILIFPLFLISLNRKFLQYVFNKF